MLRTAHTKSKPGSYQERGHQPSRLLCCRAYNNGRPGSTNRLGKETVNRKEDARATSRAAGVSPPGFEQRTRASASTRARRTADDAAANAVAVAVSSPAWADVPVLLRWSPLNRNRIGFASGFSNPHGGRTSAALGPGTFPLGMQAVCLGSGDSPTHGGRTSAAPVCAFVHRRSRNFTGKRLPCNQEQRVSTRRASGNALGKETVNRKEHARATSRAAGVSPPGFRKRTRASASTRARRTADTAATNAVAVAVSSPAWADVPVLLRWSPLNRNNRIGFASGFSNPHGGRTPAALVLRESAPVCDSPFPLPVRYRPTAGERLPLLCMCVCASQKSQFHRQTSALQPRAAGVNPPCFD